MCVTINPQRHITGSELASALGGITEPPALAYPWGLGCFRAGAEVWIQDEMRVGKKNKLTYRWARKGSRPQAAHDQRTQSTYLFGAVCRVP